MIKKCISLIAFLFFLLQIQTSDSIEIGVRSRPIFYRDQIKVGDIYYICASQLAVKSSDKRVKGKVLGYLDRNDQVRIVRSNGLDGKYVEIEIVKTKQTIKKTWWGNYYINFTYMSEIKDTTQLFTSNYFMIQNIATKRLRVYEIVCRDGSCPHKMVLETEVIIGDDTTRNRSVLGAFHITNWVKFYQDNKRTYPSWYHFGLESPLPPPPGSSRETWSDRQYLHNDIEDGVRGAFGWYAALVGPNHDHQWIHGTIGWGEDKKRFIIDGGSHGCTRTDNETISYLRHILPTGTPIIKIYAKEAYLDETLTEYQDESETASWEYALIKKGLQSRELKEHVVDRQQVYDLGYQNEDILEMGTYTIDKFPNVGEDDDNAYRIDESDFSGVFYVDAGQIHDYQHPSSLVVMGEEKGLPDFITFRN